MKTLEKDIQKVTDDAVKHIDDMTANKEKELWKSKINRKTQLALLAEFYSKEGNMNTNLTKFYRWTYHR